MEYFSTFDIQALADGFWQVLDDENGEFIHSGDFPYETGSVPYYTFFVAIKKLLMNFWTQLKSSHRDKG